MTIRLTIERDRMSEFHKSSRYRCKLIAPDGRKLFASTRNAGSVSLAKRDAEDLFSEIRIVWRESDDPEIRAVAEVEL